MTADDGRDDQQFAGMDPGAAAMHAGAEVEQGGEERFGEHHPRTQPPDLPPNDDALPRGQHGPTADYGDERG
jgi:hypothetical protein